MRIYAGNVAPDVTEDELRGAFRAFGQVNFVRIMQEQFEDACESFGLVGMPDRMEARAAIAGLNGRKLKGQSLTVTEAGVRSRSMEVK